jgi:hypothetical protein
MPPGKLKQNKSPKSETALPSAGLCLVYIKTLLCQQHCDSNDYIYISAAGEIPPLNLTGEHMTREVIIEKTRFIVNSYSSENAKESLEDMLKRNIARNAEHEFKKPANIGNSGSGIIAV